MKVVIRVVGCRDLEVVLGDFAVPLQTRAQLCVARLELQDLPNITSSSGGQEEGGERVGVCVCVCVYFVYVCVWFFRQGEIVSESQKGNDLGTMGLLKFLGLPPRGLCLHAGLCRRRFGHP